MNWNTYRGISKTIPGLGLDHVNISTPLLYGVTRGLKWVHEKSNPTDMREARNCVAPAICTPERTWVQRFCISMPENGPTSALKANIGLVPFVPIQRAPGRTL